MIKNNIHLQNGRSFPPICDTMRTDWISIVAFSYVHQQQRMCTHRGMLPLKCAPEFLLFGKILWATFLGALKSCFCSRKKVPTNPHSLFMLGKSRTQTANSLGQRASRAPTRLAAKGFVSQNAVQTQEKTTQQPRLCSPWCASSERVEANVHSFKRTRCFHTGVTLVWQQKSNTQLEPQRHLQLNFGCSRGATE